MPKGQSRSPKPEDILLPPSLAGVVPHGSHESQAGNEQAIPDLRMTETFLHSLRPFPVTLRRLLSVLAFDHVRFLGFH